MHRHRFPVSAFSKCAIIGAIALTAASASADDSAQYQTSYRAERNKQFSVALNALNRISKAGRDKYIFHLRSGWLLYLSGKHTQSVDAYQRAINKQPAAIEARLGLTLPQMALRRFADAAKTAQQAASIDKDNYLATSRLAFCLYNLGRYQKSASYYERLVTLYPGDIEMRVGLAWALLKLGRSRAARRHFNYALAIAPQHASARQGLGLLK